MNASMQECLNICVKCQKVCRETQNYALSKGGKYAESSVIKALTDCAEICKTCADFCCQESEQCGQVCHTCAEICERCAQVCGKFADDPQFKKCIEACRRCAEVCRRMPVPAA